MRRRVLIALAGLLAVGVGGSAGAATLDFVRERLPFLFDCHPIPMPM